MNFLKQIIFIALGIILLTGLGQALYNKGKTDLITHLEQYGNYQSTQKYLICVIKPNKNIFQYQYTTPNQQPKE